jgi:hypothetical protein
MTPTPISRLTSDSTAHNTLNQPPTVPIFLQMSPDAPQGDVRGIPGVNFQVLINGSVVQAGTTPADGRIDVRVPPGGSSTLQLLVDGAAVADYEITVDTGALDPADQVRGQQQRLRMLGYQIGSDGPDGNGVNAATAAGRNVANAEFERALVDFQVDQGLFPDGIVGNQTRPRLVARLRRRRQYSQSDARRPLPLGPARKTVLAAGA